MTTMVDDPVATGRHIANPPPEHGYSPQGVAEFTQLAAALAARGYPVYIDPDAPASNCLSVCPLCAANGTPSELVIYSGLWGSAGVYCVAGQHVLYAIGAELGVRTKLMDAIDRGRRDFDRVWKAIRTQNLAYDLPRLDAGAEAWGDMAVQAQCPLCLGKGDTKHHLEAFVSAFDPARPSGDTSFGQLRVICTEQAHDPLPALGIVTEHSLQESHGAIDWDADEAPATWLIEPLIERGQFADLYGPPGIGKSLWAQDNAFRLAAGGARVLYLDHENPAAEVKKRRRDMGHHGAPPDTLTYLSFPPVTALDTPDGAAKLHALADNLKPDVIILDTWSKFLAGDEASPSTHTEAYNLAIVPLRRKGVTVIAIDHAGKELGRGPRGGSSKVDNVDVLWLLTVKSNGRLRLERKKSRTGRGPDLVELTRLTNPLRHEHTEAKPTDVLTPDVRACVAKLDECDVPPGWGRDRAAEVLRANAYKVRNEVLSAALKVRRERGNVAADTVDLSGTGRGQVSDQ
ncbi:AAA family ATPase [Actinomadura chokoriensis]|uniref:AAA family ATPase n=1 Tax=Actinomadura chokoriensis TaxID=454156 RepID=UPI0031F7405F